MSDFDVPQPDLTPATRHDLKLLGTELRREMTELRGEVTELRGEVTELRLEVKQLGHSMFTELARLAKAMEENFRQMFAVLDDKYKDLPVEQATLRRDLDAHVADSGAHRAPRRTRRAAPRR